MSILNSLNSFFYFLIHSTIHNITEAIIDPVSLLSHYKSKMSCEQHMTFRKVSLKTPLCFALRVAFLLERCACFLAFCRAEVLCSLLLTLCFPSQLSSNPSAIILCRTLEAAQPCLSLCNYRKRVCVVQSWQHGRICSTSLQITSGCYQLSGMNDTIQQLNRTV